MKTLSKLRIALLIILFLGALVFFGYRENYIEEKPVSVLPDSALPYITLFAYGREMNELAGYVNEMNLGCMRDVILPLGDEKLMRINIHTASAKISDATYEVRPLDNSRQIEGGEISDLTEKGGIIKADIKFDNLIEKGKEYYLIFHLTANGKPVNYYTRITYYPSAHVDECLRFAEYFHNHTMDKELCQQLSTYMEPDRSADNDSLQKVTIKSSLNQLSWADFDFVQDGEIYTEISEVSATSCEITFYYDIIRKGEGARETYRVKEFYRLRRGEDRVYLLNFRRTLDEKFMMAAFQGDNEYVNLGIVDPDVSYKYNDIGTICAFVSDGELYIYSREDNTVTKVFSFRSTKERDSYRDYGIKILNIDGTGMMDFLVYGYMAAGEREGRVGMSLYHYDETSEEIEERIFIESDRSGIVFSRDLGNLLYENTVGEFFFIMDGVLEKININAARSEAVLTGLSEENYCVSGSGRFLAYMEANRDDHVNMLDLNTGETTVIRAPYGDSLFPLTFLQEDFVYGLAKKSDMAVYNANGKPMYSIRIVSAVDPVNSVFKNYEKEGYFVTDITVSGYTVYLDRVNIDEEGVMKPAKQDTIMNSQGESIDSVKVVTEYDEIKQKVVSLEMRERPINETEEFELGRIRRSVSSYVESVPSATHINEDLFLDFYYVYSGTDVVWAGSNPSAAIMNANEAMGQVWDGNARTIWKRGRASYKNTIGVSVGSFDEESSPEAKCLSAILNLEGENVEVGSLLQRGRTPKSVLESTLKDMEVLSISDVTTDQVMYYISAGTPVYTELGPGKPVLLVGYDSFNFYYFDPETESSRKIGIKDAGEATEAAGGNFLVYIR